MFKDGGTIGVTSATDAMTVSSAGIVTFKDDILIKDGGTIGVASAATAITIASTGIVTFVDDILIKDTGTIGSASDPDAIAIAANGVVTFSQVPVLPNNTVETADNQDNPVTLAKMAGLARGKIIYGDSSGNPAALALGSNGQILKSDGTDISWGTDAGFDVTSITGATAIEESLAWNDEFIIHDASAGALKRIDATLLMHRPFFRARMTGNQSIGVSSWTKVAFDGESTDGDPDSTYDTTNYRWTPGSAGWYLFWVHSQMNGSDDGEDMALSVRKNGTSVTRYQLLVSVR